MPFTEMRKIQGVSGLKIENQKFVVGHVNLETPIRYLRKQMNK